MTVAAERSSMNGPQRSTRPTGTRYPSIAMLFKYCSLILVLAGLVFLLLIFIRISENKGAVLADRNLL